MAPLFGILSLALPRLAALGARSAGLVGARAPLPSVIARISVLVVVLITLLGPTAAGASVELPAGAIERITADAAHLSLNIGPRPAGGPAEAQAAAWVRQRLEGLGWAPQAIGRDTNLLSCRGQPRRVFLAHIDSVPQSPGLIDNAVGVAILLEVARATAASPGAEGLCLGFPDAEERGLLGSAWMAERWPGDPAELELVVALDLVGQGTLGQMGLGARWSDARLAWVHGATGGRLRAPIVHRLYSRLLPHMERSDHAPFADRGAPAMLLFGMGEGEVFPRYHQPSDRPDVAPSPLEPTAVAEALGALLALVAAPAPPPPGPLDQGLALQLGPVLLPGLWVSIALALCAGLAGQALWRPDRLRALRGAGALALGTLLLPFLGIALTKAIFDHALPALLGLGLRVEGGEAERTAAAVMGAPTNGWWALAPALSLGLLALWALVRRGLRRWAVGPEPAALLGAAVAGACCLLDPVLGGLFAAAAAAARLHPALGAAPALLLLRPDALRQLSFHGLLPPAAWGALLLLAGLGLASRRRVGGRVKAPGPIPAPALDRALDPAGGSPLLGGPPPPADR